MKNPHEVAIRAGVAYIIRSNPTTRITRAGQVVYLQDNLLFDGDGKRMREAPDWLEEEWNKMSDENKRLHPLFKVPEVLSAPEPVGLLARADANGELLHMTKAELEAIAIVEGADTSQEDRKDVMIEKILAGRA